MRQIQPHRQVSQIDALRIQQLLVDRIEAREVVHHHRVPQLCAILLTQKHDRFARARAQVVCLLDGVDVQVVHDCVGVVEADEGGGGEGGGVEGQAPGEMCVFFYIVFTRRGGGICGLSARVQVVQQTERVVPFERDVFVREPEVCGRNVGVDEVWGEEGVEVVREEREVGEAWELYLTHLV
jgi:hypothetical protein